MIEFSFMIELPLMLIRQANQGIPICVTIGIFQIKVLSFNQMHAVNAMIY